MFKIKFKEPVAPRYIHIDPVDNKVHLLTPVIGGQEIGTDNTCKSAIALQTFFGKNRDVSDKNSALNVLKDYQIALEHDIALIMEESELKQRKQDRLNQIKQYIAALNRVQDSEQMSRLRYVYPEYPQPFITLMKGNGSNLYSMVLRPEKPDQLLRSENRVFIVDPDSDQGELFKTLQGAYTSINWGTLKTPKKLLEETVIALLPEDASLEAVQEALHSKALTLFEKEIDIDFKHSSDLKEEINELYVCIATDDVEYINNVPKAVYSDVSIKDCVEALTGACVGDALWDSASPFDHLRDAPESQQKERLSILTQFFLGEVNIYCRVNNLSQSNFGQVLDNSSMLSTVLVNVVKNALSQDQNVEDKLFEFINRNFLRFGLPSHLTPEQQKTIADKFRSHYLIIKGSQHFDEFTILDTTNELGKFVRHQQSICVDFAEVIGAGYIDMDNDYFRDLRESNNRVQGFVEHENSSVAASYEMKDQALFARLRILSENQNPGDLDLLVTLLLAENEDGLNSFALIPSEMKEELLDSPHWDNVRSKLDNQAKIQYILPKEVVITLFHTGEELGFLRFNPLTVLNDNIDVLNKIRRTLGLMNIPFSSLSSNEPNGYLINLSRSALHQLYRVIHETVNTTVELIPTTIPTIPTTAYILPRGIILNLIFAAEQLGLMEFNELAGLDVLTKIRRTLAVLNIPFGSLSSNEPGSYLVNLSPPALHRMYQILRENIANVPFQLTPVAQEPAELAAQQQAAELAAQQQAAELAAQQQAAELAAQQQAAELAAQQQAAELAAQQQAAELAAQQQAAELAAQQQAAELAAQQQAAELAAQQQADELAAQQQADELAAQQQADELAAQQQADELAAQQQADELAAQQQADELAAQQQADELAAQQQADELAAQQQADELAAQQQAAELADQQQADELAAQQQADELAAQQQAAELAQADELAAQQQAAELADQQPEQKQESKKKQKQKQKLEEQEPELKQELKKKRKQKSKLEEQEPELKQEIKKKRKQKPKLEEKEPELKQEIKKKRKQKPKLEEQEPKLKQELKKKRKQKPKLDPEKLANFSAEQEQLINKINREITRLEPAKKLAGSFWVSMKFIKASDKKIAALEALRDIVSERTINTKSVDLAEQLNQWKKEYGEHIEKQRNILHTKFSPGHKTITESMVEGLFKELNVKTQPITINPSSSS